MPESLCWVRDETWEEFADQFANRLHFVMFAELANQVL